ncbi:hypothetical protein K439DRAFT_1620959 [Ramaria rubella]|nr:hypothetical protein K439DRAFT_1620959 [Ramaria rubella]
MLRVIQSCVAISPKGCSLSRCSSTVGVVGKGVTGRGGRGAVGGGDQSTGADTWRCGDTGVLLKGSGAWEECGVVPWRDHMRSRSKGVFWILIWGYSVGVFCLDSDRFMVEVEDKKLSGMQL